VKILIIGGTGAISTAFTRECVNKGWDVWVINRANHPDRIPSEAIPMIGDINTEFVPSNIDNNWDSIIDFTIWNKIHAERAIKLFGGKTKQFLFLNSTCIYKHSMLGERITEDSPIEGNPIWQYQKDKFEARMVLLGSGLPLTEVRPGHTYDKFTIPTNIMGLGYGLVERIKQGKEIIIHDDGQSKWTLTHSSDVAKGLVGLVGNKDTIGECFHITHESAPTWMDIFKCYGFLLDKEINPVFIPSIRICQINSDLGESLVAHRSLNKVFDNSKIKKFVPGYNPEISFKKGIQMSVNWHEENPDKIFYKKESDKLVDEIIKTYQNYKEY
jgi:nucleoside-diphosphate-sugar epimerase